MQPVTTRVTVRNFPKVFAAFMAVLISNGGVNRLEPAPKYFDVPEPFIKLLNAAELQLIGLTVDELETIVEGEDTEAEELIGRKRLKEAHELLNAYFEDFII
jgi:hypothetical protein